MTKKDNIPDYKNFLAQNLYLLTHNESFNKDIEKLKTKHGEELRKINPKSKIILNKAGSEQLQEDINKLCDKVALSQLPKYLVVKAVVVYLLNDMSIKPLLKKVEENKGINTLTAPPKMKVQEVDGSVNMEVSFSPYFGKTEVLKYINDNWQEVEKVKGKINKVNVPLQRPQPFTNFKRDLSILEKKNSGVTYEALTSYKLWLFPDAVKKIVRKLRRRIRQLYETSG